jgi:hypothetical protein
MEPSEPAHVGDQIGEADDPDGAGRRDVGHRSDLDHDRGGQASIFVTVDHASSECLGIHAARRATRFEALSLVVAQARPTVRTIRPSRHFWAANTCSIATRTRARVALPRAMCDGMARPRGFGRWN